MSTLDLTYGGDDPAPGAVEIGRADFDDPTLRTFLQAHLDDLAPTAPAGSRHALDLRALRRPGVRLWTARIGGALVGTAALAVLDSAHEELKSMRTDPAHRGAGIATSLLGHLVADARERGVERISLETGTAAFFGPARALYAKHGFAGCEPFGSYRRDPHSTFMTRLV